MGAFKNLFTQWQTGVADAGELLLPHEEQIQAFARWADREGFYPSLTTELSEEELQAAYEQGYEQGKWDCPVSDQGETK